MGGNVDARAISNLLNEEIELGFSKMLNGFVFKHLILIMKIFKKHMLGN